MGCTFERAEITRGFSSSTAEFTVDSDVAVHRIITAVYYHSQHEDSISNVYTAAFDVCALPEKCEKGQRFLTFGPASSNPF